MTETMRRGKPRYRGACHGLARPGLARLGKDFKGAEMTEATVIALRDDQTTNGGEDMLDMSLPYLVSVAIEGVAQILFHRWNVEAVETKSKAAKGSTAKKSDDVESYLYRTDAGEI